MNASNLMIGAYYLAPYASTPEHVRDLAQCGIDVVMNMRNDRPTLDLLAQHGVKAVVSGIVPGWFGGDGSNAGTMHEKNPLSRYENAADGFEDHPAIWGIDAGDEPSSLDFPHYGQVIDLIQRRFPEKTPYLNIYPSYAVKGSNTPQEVTAQLGTDRYADYIERYVRSVPTPYICFDYYLYSADLPRMYESLLTVSKACRQHNRSMWTVLQVNSHNPEVFISERQLQFQANCALAFGAQAVIWACYCAGWWHNHVLDRQGNKTQQYDKLQRVNAALHAIGPNYMQYRHIATHFVGPFSPEELSKTDVSAIPTLSIAAFQHLHAGDGKLLVGQMTLRTEQAGEALFIASADDPSGISCQERTVWFESDRAVKTIGPEGVIPITRHESGVFSFTLQACQGALLIAE